MTSWTFTWICLGAPLVVLVVLRDGSRGIGAGRWVGVAHLQRIGIISDVIIVISCQHQSWSRTSAKNKNQLRSDITNVIGCHHQSWSHTSAKNKNQLRSDVTNVIGCHHQSCNCTYAKCLHLYSNWGRVAKEWNILAITIWRNLYGVEYVDLYGGMNSEGIEDPK